MDRIKETANVIKEINKYRRDEIKDFELIKSVCEYFDQVKTDKELSQADLIFLKYISNIIGVPHFYDLLEKFGNKIEFNGFNLSTFSSILYESTLHTDSKNKVHKYQQQILELFHNERGQNRYFLSASTSFGKTHLVFEIIKKMEYKNILLIFPTIALLSENLEKLLSDKYYNDYSIHMLSEVESFGNKNIFIYTPERFLSFIEKNELGIEFDFVFVDEVYKIDNEYIIDEEVRENERDVAYRLAIYYGLKYGYDMLLAGPYIDFQTKDNNSYNSSFDNFLSKNEIVLLDYNNYEIVTKSFTDIKGKKQIKVDENLSFNFKSATKKDEILRDIITTIIGINESLIVYCFSRSSVESYAKKIIKSGVLLNHNSSKYSNFITHLSERFSHDWVVIKALKNGIGIHHGLVPKYIQKEIVSLFNNNQLKVLISTTTITEGVNTSAKNLVVMHNKKGNKELKKFDAKNIAGRAGRFLHHYSGRVIVLQNDFLKAIEAEPEGIKHKNYDLNSPKDEIDLYYTDEQYLTELNKLRILNLEELRLDRGIPDFILSQYKVISRIDKITLYDVLSGVTTSNFDKILTLIGKINYKMDIDLDGFQEILEIIRPIIKNENLLFLINNKDSNEKYSTLTYLVHYYLVEGFDGSVKYKMKTQGKTIDEAIRETSDFIYNTLKYQLVKYLGVFNIMYKFYLSQKQSDSFEEINGIERLLIKLEYNALTKKGKVASDFGVPTNVINYYEKPEDGEKIKENFDQYELESFKKMEKLFEER